MLNYYWASTGAHRLKKLKNSETHMALFDDTWMKGFQAQWNAEPGLYEALANINFNSVIGYGFKGDDQATGYLVVENGQCIEAILYPK